MDVQVLQETLADLRARREVVARNTTLRSRVKTILGRGEPMSVAAIDTDIEALEQKLREAEAQAAVDPRDLEAEGEAIKKAILSDCRELDTHLRAAERVIDRLAGYGDQLTRDFTEAKWSATVLTGPFAHSGSWLGVCQFLKTARWGHMSAVERLAYWRSMVTELIR